MEINTAGIDEIVSVNRASNIFTKQEMVIFTFSSGTLEDYFRNHTERFVLRSILYQNGLNQYISDEYCIEMEKVGKALIKGLVLEEQKLASRNPNDERRRGVRQLARFVYGAATSRMAQVLMAKEEKKDLDTPKKASAYFSRIIHELMKEEMLKAKHQAESIESVYRHIKDQLMFATDNQYADYNRLEAENADILSRKNYYEDIYQVLRAICERWMLARFQNTVTDLEESLSSEEAENRVKLKRNWSQRGDSLQYVESLFEKEKESLLELYQHMKRMGNGATGAQKTFDALVSYRNVIQSCYESCSDRLTRIS